MDNIRAFYSKIQFPGPYSLNDLKFYDDELLNPYLLEFDNAIKDCETILDIGCGSGFILNFLARRYPNKRFTAIDFSNSIDYAIDFSYKNNIDNVKFYKEDFLDWEPKAKFDLVICNGVLHHIPEFNQALNKIKRLTKKKLVIGLYNRYGKIAKKFFPVSYVNHTLFLDQEKCPFELSFTNNQVKKMFYDYNLINVYPSIKNRLVDIFGLFNYKNGGLTLYTYINRE